MREYDFTVIESQSDVPCTKKFVLSGDEVAVIPPAPLTIGSFAQVRGTIKNIEELFCEGNPNQALLSGVPRGGHAAGVVAYTAGMSVDEWAAKHDIDVPVIERKEKDFEYPDGGGILLLDIDPPKGGSLSAWDVVDALEQVAVRLKSRPMVVAASTSTYIFHGQTRLKGSGGYRVAVPVQEAKRIPDYIRRLHVRLALSGMCWSFVSEAGSFYLRSMVDTAVAQASRLFFLAAHTVAPIKQRRPSPLTLRMDAPPLVESDIPPLTAEEEAAFTALQIQMKQESAAEIAEKRDGAVYRLAQRTLSKRGITQPTFSQLAEARDHAREVLDGGRLSPDTVLSVAGLGEVFVSEILENPDDFLGKRCLSPVEPDYRGGAYTGWIYRAGQTLCVYDHAHGGRVFSMSGGSRWQGCFPAATDVEEWAEPVELSATGRRRLLAYRSAMGRGKSTAAVRMAKAFKALGGRILAITPHRSLVAKDAHRYSIQHYGADIVNGRGDMAVCSPSLHLVEPTDDPTMIILDEVALLLSSIHRGPIYGSGEAAMTHNRLKRLLHTAQVVVVAQDGLDEATASLIQEMSGIDEVEWPDKSVRPARVDAPVTFCDSAAALLARVDDSLAHGRKVAVATTQRRDAEAVLRLITERTDSYIAVTAESSEKDRATLQDVTHYWRHYDAIVYTMAAGQGISYDVKDERDVFLLAPYVRGITGESLTQMLRRIRHPRSVCVYVGDAPYPGTTDEAEIVDAILSTASMEADLWMRFDPSLGVDVASNIDFVQLLAQMEARTRRLSVDMVGYVREWCRSIFRSYRPASGDDDDKVEKFDSAFRGARAAVREERVRRVVSAPELSYAQVEKLRRRREKGRATKKEVAAIRKYEIGAELGVSGAMAETLCECAVRTRLLHRVRAARKFRDSLSGGLLSVFKREAKALASPGGNAAEVDPAGTRLVFAREIVETLAPGLWAALESVMAGREQSYSVQGIGEAAVEGVGEYVRENKELLSRLGLPSNGLKASPMAYLGRVVVAATGLKLQRHQRRVGGRRLSEYRICVNSRTAFEGASDFLPVVMLDTEKKSSKAA